MLPFDQGSPPKAHVLSIPNGQSNDVASLLRPFEPSVELINAGGTEVPRYESEFWTSRQRQASSLHEISYRACFKPQLAAFFVDRFSREGDLVYDPFSGRGTTILEAGLAGRRVAANDVNPLSAILSLPRFHIPDTEALRQRLLSMEFPAGKRADIDVSMFYHPDTESEIVGLQSILNRRRQGETEDNIDRWIRMVATNRLTGHSKGFFSVYTLPPNQAVTPERQELINRRLGQVPEYRDTRSIIFRKSRQLLKTVTPEQMRVLRESAASGLILTGDARRTPSLRSDSVSLIVTSPPFLNMVDYGSDNWLRCWFNGIDADEVAKSITTTSSLKSWTAVMEEVFAELHRVTRPGGWVAFEVGEVRKASIRLDEHIVPIGIQKGFICEGVLVNRQKFTKTSNIWGVDNNSSGTNTNRIVLFEKP